jgi:hypothetical protein
MNKINILLDYKNRFESKYSAIPYRSGFNLDLLSECFKKMEVTVSYFNYPDLDFRNKDYHSEVFLYCSSEDKDGFYKSYIEDLVFGLKMSGAIIIPDYIYLKAHNNKIFMEIIRDILLNQNTKTIESKYFGTIEELKKYNNYYNLGDYVVKPALGSMSKGVSQGKDFNETLLKSKNVSKSPLHSGEFIDFLRKYKYSGYIRDSRFRRKFLIQNKIRNLNGDWKVLVFWDKYYALKRKNRPNDFRASGSGQLSYCRELPDGLLSYAEQVYQNLNVPNLSIDIGFDGENFFLLEFQAFYFGTYTLEKSDFYFKNSESGWVICEGTSVIEEEYARSVCLYIKKYI